MLVTGNTSIGFAPDAPVCYKDFPPILSAVGPKPDPAQAANNAAADAAAKTANANATAAKNAVAAATASGDAAALASATAALNAALAAQDAANIASLTGSAQAGAISTAQTALSTDALNKALGDGQAVAHDDAGVIGGKLDGIGKALTGIGNQLSGDGSGNVSGGTQAPYTTTSNTDFSGRLNTFFSDMKSQPLLGFANNVIGSIPSSGTSSVSFSGGRFGTHTIDFSTFAGFFSMLHKILMIITIFVCVRIISKTQ